MAAETWGLVKRLFDAALPLPAAERHRFLESECIGAKVRDEVLSLLTVHDSDPEFLNSSTPSIDPAAFACTLGAPSHGERAGPWLLKREVGRGGMGVVWEAERADGAYEQTVAVKFVQFPALGRLENGRLTEERRILAGLNHSGIARLLDGGATAGGSPYLVMEFVDGEPIDAWCERRNATIRERLEVFLRVCGAVEYAHRHLVVHRDLKPANILVTHSGAPKLLDFGIAKLVDSAGLTSANTTATASRLLTPDYASPEQIRGEPVSTSTDVYSLGVVLYVLLCGAKPYAAQGAAPLELMRAICETDPAPPSAAAPPSLRKTLAGELDAIVLQALRKSPDERYASVRAFSDDIRAWLRGEPVAAHPPGVCRRALKLIRRNRSASVAAAVAVVSLAVGTAATAWQAHIARQAQTRAENRFRQVRQFSRSLLFELHESISSLPGSTAARRQLLSKATEFLDGLAGDAGGEASLKVELAEGYRRLGHVQGSAISDNLGQRLEAVRSFQKAARLAEEALAAAPANTEAALVLTGAYDDLTDAAFMGGNHAEAGAWFAKHDALARRLDAQKDPTPKVRVSVATSFASLGYHRARMDDLAAAKRLYEASVDRFAALVREGEDSRELRSQYPFALKRLGAILIAESDLDGAEKRYREALAIEDAVLAKNPSNPRLKVDRTLTQSDLALILKKRGDTAGAARIYEEVLATRLGALAAEPANVRLTTLTASTQSNLALLYSSTGRHAEAIAAAREAVRLRDTNAAKANSPHEDCQAAGARVLLSERLLAAALTERPPAARASLVRSARSTMNEAQPALEKLRKRGAVTGFDKSLLADHQALAERMSKLGP